MVWSSLDEETRAKVPAGKFEFISASVAYKALERGREARIYGYAERGEFAGQIVRIWSAVRLQEWLDAGTLGFIWISGNGIADIIRKR